MRGEEGVDGGGQDRGVLGAMRDEQGTGIGGQFGWRVEGGDALEEAALQLDHGTPGQGDGQGRVARFEALCKRLGPDDAAEAFLGVGHGGPKYQRVRLVGPARDGGGDKAALAPPDHGKTLAVNGRVGLQPVDCGQSVGNLALEGGVGKGTGAFARPAEVDPQGGDALFGQEARGAGEDSFIGIGDGKFVADAGEAVEEEDHGRGVARRDFQGADHRAKRRVDGHGFFGLGEGGGGEQSKAGGQNAHRTLLGWVRTGKRGGGAFVKRHRGCG